MAKFVVIYEEMHEDAVTPDLLKELVKGHIEHLKDLHSKGILFLCGPLGKGGEMGLLIFEANSQKEAEGYVLKDPLIAHKCYGSYRIYDWIMADDSNNWLMDE
jgi:uncharacterized protein YciI